MGLVTLKMGEKCQLGDQLMTHRTWPYLECSYVQ